MRLIDRLIPRHQRVYIYSHPLAVWFSISVLLVGLANILFPESVDQSAASILFPAWLKVIFNLTWTLGGGLASAGILSGRRNMEAAGMALLSSGLLASFLATMSVRPSALGSAIFVVGLAVGCALRSLHLARTGYANLKS